MNQCIFLIIGQYPMLHYFVTITIMRYYNKTASIDRFKRRDFHMDGAVLRKSLIVEARSEEPRFRLSQSKNIFVGKKPDPEIPGKFWKPNHKNL